MVERRTENPCVASSILALGTRKNTMAITSSCFSIAVSWPGLNKGKFENREVFTDAGESSREGGNPFVGAQRRKSWPPAYRQASQHQQNTMAITSSCFVVLTFLAPQPKK